MCDPPKIYPSLPEYTPFSTAICDAPRIYPSLPPRIYLPFKNLCATLPESTPPSHPEYTPFFINIYDTPFIHSPFFRNEGHTLIIYPSLLEDTPLLYNVTLIESTSPSRNLPLFCNYRQSSQNLHLPPRIYLHPHYYTLPESIPPPPLNIYKRPSHHLLLPHRMYPF